MNAETQIELMEKQITTARELLDTLRAIEARNDATQARLEAKDDAFKAAALERQEKAQKTGRRAGIAAECLGGLLASGAGGAAEEVAEEAVELADALLAALEKP